MTKKFEVVSNFNPAGDQPEAIKQLTEGVMDGLASQTLLGVTGSGKTYSIACVIENIKRTTMIMAPNKTLAAQLYGEFKNFFPKNAVEYFVSYYDYYQPEAYVPSSDTFIEKDASINDHIEQMRLSATKALMEKEDAIIVATVSAIYGLGDPDAYFKMVMHLDRGDVIDQREILRRLAELQYTRNDLELKRATYRVRGEIIDIFPAESSREAIRLDLFCDELENISWFDPLTGEILRKVPRVTIYPKSHYATPRETIVDATELIKDELVERLGILKTNNQLVEAQRLEQRVFFDIEMMLELGYCNGIENYSRYLSGRKPGTPPPTLFDYLPEDAFLVLDESHVTIPQIGAMYRGDRSRKETLVEYGFRLPSALDNRPMTFLEWENRRPQVVFVSATPGKYEAEHQDQVVEQVVRPTGLIDPEVEVRGAGYQVDDLLSEINIRVPKKERILVTTLTKRMAEDLTDYLSEQGVKVRYLHSDIDTVQRVEIIKDLRLGVFDVLVGINLLREGLDIPEVSLVAILDADKEGFLRSERSIIQTIGRAARNINGKAILYGDSITGSMERAISETARRQKLQLAFNKKHGIVPKGVSRDIKDILEAAIPGSQGIKLIGKKAQLEQRQIEEIVGDIVIGSQESFEKVIKKLEKLMFEAARNLEFEKASSYRDELQRIRELSLRS